jgi:hypothetical protein
MADEADKLPDGDGQRDTVDGHFFKGSPAAVDVTEFFQT